MRINSYKYILHTQGVLNVKVKYCYNCIWETRKHIRYSVPT